LILQGDKIIPLAKSVINIGRKSSNQIVINDLRVSRIHAQIRRIQETYVVFDVGSTGGTYVNSERVNQHTLRPGDVISLAGYPIIYTEDQSVIKEKPKEKTAELKVHTHEEKS
jgi:pSer/pThr/pTyr-binding forkhead associated (FHA) protein